MVVYHGNVGTIDLEPNEPEKEATIMEAQTSMETWIRQKEGKTYIEIGEIARDLQREWEIIVPKMPIIAGWLTTEELRQVIIGPRQISSNINEMFIYYYFENICRDELTERARRSKRMRISDRRRRSERRAEERAARAEKPRK
jgi:hypothetical protein